MSSAAQCMRQMHLHRSPFWRKDLFMFPDLTVPPWTTSHGRRTFGLQRRRAPVPALGNDRSRSRLRAPVLCPSSTPRFTARSCWRGRHPPGQPGLYAPCQGQLLLSRTASFFAFSFADTAFGQPTCRVTSIANGVDTHHLITPGQ